MKQVGLGLVVSSEDSITMIEVVQSERNTTSGTIGRLIVCFFLSLRERHF